MEKFGLEGRRGFWALSDEKLDNVVITFISTHGPDTGHAGYNVIGYIKLLGYRVHGGKV